MKDLYTIDKPYLLKARLKGQADEIRHLKREKQRLLARALQLNNYSTAKCVKGPSIQRDPEQTDEQYRAEIAQCRLEKQRRRASLRNLDQQTAPDQQKIREIRTLACHLVEVAPRRAARHTLLAYMYARGKAYLTAEQSCYWSNKPNALLVYQQMGGRVYDWGTKEPKLLVEIRTWLAAPPAAKAQHVSIGATYNAPPVVGQQVHIPAE